MNSSEIDNKKLKEKIFISEGKVGALEDPHNKCLLDNIKSNHILKERNIWKNKKSNFI
jgi:hypothetical protein